MGFRESLDNGAGDQGGALGQDAGIFRRAELIFHAVAGEEQQVARRQSQFDRLGNHRALPGLADDSIPRHHAGVGRADPAQEGVANPGEMNDAGFARDVGDSKGGPHGFLQALVD